MKFVQSDRSIPTAFETVGLEIEEENAAGGKLANGSVGFFDALELEVMVMRLLVRRT
jgi:hypothetical protein